jgi:hypothetical protein
MPLSHAKILQHIASSYEMITTLLFGAVTPRGIVGGYQNFGETYRLHLQGWWCYLPASLLGITIQNNNTVFFTTVRTSDIILLVHNDLKKDVEQIDRELI